MPAAAAADPEKRLHKRLRSIQVVQSHEPFRFYLAHCLRGEAAPILEPPDPYELGVSCRRWRWLMRVYDGSLKAYHAAGAPAQPAAGVT